MVEDFFVVYDMETNNIINDGEKGESVEPEKKGSNMNFE